LEEISQRRCEGVIFQFGRYVLPWPRDKAAPPLDPNLFFKLAILNQADALNNLAFTFEHRQLNDVDALDMYYKAATQGHPDASVNFANLCRRKGLTSKPVRDFLHAQKQCVLVNELEKFVGSSPRGPTKFSDKILKVII